MKKLGFAALLALLVGCAADGRYADTHYDRAKSCKAPAVRLCAGCEVTCSRHDRAYCAPGHSMPPQGTIAGYCQEEASCRCED